MVLDYQSFILDRLYDEFGVEATLRVDDWGEDLSVTVIDKTSGIPVNIGGAEVQTIVPAAAIRVSEITGNGKDRADVDAGSIEFNGKCWQFEATLPRPTPNGENAGELFLILSELDDD